MHLAPRSCTNAELLRRVMFAPKVDAEGAARELEARGYDPKTGARRN